MSKAEQLKKESLKREKKKGGKRSAVLSLVLVIILTLFSFMVSFYSAGDGDIAKGLMTIIDAIGSGDPLWLAIIAGLMVLSYFIEALIILVFCRLYTRRYYLHQGMANVMIGAFYSTVTPGTSGGQVMQVYTMKKQGLEVSNAASIMVMWFILYQVSLIVFDVLALIFEWDLIMQIKSFRIGNFELFGWDGTITMTPLIIIGFSVNVGAILLLSLMSYSHTFHNFIMHFGIGLLARIKIIKNPDKTREKLRIQVENFRIELKRLQGNIPVTILIISLFLILFTIRFSIPYFSGLALNAYGVNEGFRWDMLYDACFRSAFHQMVSGLVPIPGGAGISELVYNSMFSGFFVETYITTEAGLEVVRTVAANVMATQVLWRIATFYLVLVSSGLVAAFYRSRSNKDELTPYANRQAFIDYQLQAYDQRKQSYETLYETKKLSRKEISKRLSTDYMAKWGLLTGDDYLGPDNPNKEKQRKAGEDINLED